MTTTAANVRIAVTGEIYRGQPGATLPTDATTALTGFAGSGYITPEGVSEVMNKSTTKLRAWQNNDNVRTITTEHDLEYTFMCMETTAETLALYYGENAYASGVVEISNSNGYRCPWVFDVIDGDDVARVVIPDGEIVNESTTLTYVGTDAVKYQIRIVCYPGADGVKARKYYAALAA